MSIFELLWLFIILSSLQPVVRQRFLELQRMRALRDIESKRKTRVIGMIHRQDTMSFLGFPIARFIDIEDSEQVLRAVYLTDKTVPIDMILHTPGGLVLASEQIADALRKHEAKVTVFVPHYAMSGGTLIALAADEIVMSNSAVLGPVDPQLNQMPAASILKVIDEKPVAEIDDQTLIQADVARKALHQVQAAVAELLGDYMKPEEATRVSRVLASGTWTHDYPIRVDEGRKLGLPISTSMPSQILDLMQLYPQAKQGRPSVSYIPQPYGPDGPLPASSVTRERY